MSEEILFYDCCERRPITRAECVRHYKEDDFGETFAEYLQALYFDCDRGRNDLLRWKDGARYYNEYQMLTEQEAREIYGDIDEALEHELITKV